MARVRSFARRLATCVSTRRCLAQAICPTSWRRRPWRWNSACRSTPSPARAAQLRPAHHRGELLRLPGGVTLIDDSYNSSPSALQRALHVVKVASGSARKVAVLGEMLELGTHAERLHRESGAVVAAAKLDLLIAVGGAAARALADAAIENGMAAACVVYATTSARSGGPCGSANAPWRPGPGQGFAGIGTDAIVDRLKAEYA